MPSSFYSPNARSDLLCKFIDVTIIVITIIITIKNLSLANLIIINCDCRGICEST